MGLGPLECADVYTGGSKGSGFRFETVLNSRLEVLTFPKQIQTCCEPAVHADDRPEAAVHADARPRDSGPTQLRAMKNRSMSCRCFCLRVKLSKNLIQVKKLDYYHLQFIGLELRYMNLF